MRVLTIPISWGETELIHIKLVRITPRTLSTMSEFAITVEKVPNFMFALVFQLYNSMKVVRIQ